MTTPEKKVKDKVKAVLSAHGVYHFMPATHGYGSSGVPDITACMKGRFIGIECKANGNKPTALQMKNLNTIKSTGGMAILVDETGIEGFKALIDAWANPKWVVPSGGLITLLNNADQAPI